MSRTSHSLVFAAIVAFLQLDNVISSEIPEFPRNRFIPWNKLDWITKSDARYLLFTEDTWNNFMTSPLERMSYDKVAQFLGLNNAQFMSQWERTNIALQHIAIDSRTWDCWINHYTGNDWAELRDKHNVSWAFEILGWSESTWKSQDPEDWPETESKQFEELTPEEILAAERICCGVEIWNGYPLTEWEYDTFGVSTAELNFRTKHRQTASPSFRPSLRPTLSPTLSQAIIKEVETEALFENTEAPTEYVRFTQQPTESPTSTPSSSPTGAPTNHPSLRPSGSPSYLPSKSISPSSAPTASPTTSSAPSNAPTTEPSYQPSNGPSYQPSTSINPSSSPTNAPTISTVPSNRPSKGPSYQPSGSFFPSLAPTSSPTASSAPSNSPTNSPTTSPSSRPSRSPSTSPSFSPSVTPSLLPSDGPSLEPSLQPSSSPSASPSGSPTATPSSIPSVFPTTMPSDVPTALDCPANFTLVLFTDKYPKETTWTLAMVSSGKLVAEGFGYKNDLERHEETMCIKFDTCYMFEIKDKWDDGICCENGQGSYAGFIEYFDSVDDPVPIPGVNGGAFETTQRHKFCLDETGNPVEEEGLGNAIGVRFNGRHGQT